MGIPQLNQYLQQHSDHGIREITLNHLRGRKIVIDTSIFMYKYLSENALVENFYLMITKFRQFNIVPLFVFDGRPPPEKYAEINIRKQKKEQAKREYDCLILKYNKEQNPHRKISLKTTLENLKRQFIKVTYKDIETVKTLMQSYGVSYYEASGEADSICAALVNCGQAYACLSEDMDLFVYGCNKVLRYLSLLNSTVVEYDTIQILKDLGMTYEEFKHVCIITGCDYVKKHQRSLHSTIELFKLYQEDQHNMVTFYDWVISNTDYFDKSIEFNRIEELFNLDNYDKDVLKNIQIFNSSLNTERLVGILTEHGFIFV